MNENSQETRPHVSRTQKSFYALAFGIIALMLYVVGFPVFILVFFGVLAFFIWKALASASHDNSKQIFDLYLSASDILHDDGRKWFGFEVREAIAKGETIVASMPTVPPLVRFALGALYQRVGDHARAVQHLEQAVGHDAPDEMSMVYPDKDLRSYVRLLRKVERSPAEAPLTSSAVRFLERCRGNNGDAMLNASRAALSNKPLELVEEQNDSIPNNSAQKKRSTISEVLHDVYDRNVQ